ncbi:MAG: methionine biosynthesis protein MetW [Nitrososphaeraceae archaeon]
MAFLRLLLKASFGNKIQYHDLFDNYDEYWSSGAIKTDLPEYVNTAKLIENWFEVGSTVLDVGIGPGVIAEYLIDKKHLKISGLDISQVACQRAMEKGIYTEVRDITNGLGLKKNETYDYIVLSEVIEHTIYPQKILRDAVRHAQRGVVTTIPNSAFIVYRIQLLRGYSPRQSFTHLHCWSINDFRIFCDQLGIKPLKLAAPLPRYLSRLKNLLAYQQAWLLAPWGKT